MFESTEAGLSLSLNQFMDDNDDDEVIDLDNNVTSYRICFMIFWIYNLLLSMTIISLSRTVLSNPGYLSKNYTEKNSLIKFFKDIVEFLSLNKKNNDGVNVITSNKEDINSNESKLFWKLEEYNQREIMTRDIKEILQNEKYIVKKKNEIAKYLLSISTNNNAVKSSLNDLDEINEYGTNKGKNLLNRSKIYKEDKTKFENDIKNENAIKLFTRDERKNNIEKVIENPLASLNKKNILELFQENYQINYVFERVTLIKDPTNCVCYYCCQIKTDRSHHCRQCKSCVRKMDHHCLFLCSCVGFNNYKYFILTVFYGWLTLLFVCFTMYRAIFYYIDKRNQTAFYITIQYFLLFLLTMVITYFFSMHFGFLINNSTTIEHVDKKTDSKNFYNIGVYNNIRSVMGNWYTWLIPIEPDRSFTNEGYEFDINNEVYDRVKKEFLDKLNEKNLKSDNIQNLRCDYNPNSHESQNSKSSEEYSPKVLIENKEKKIKKNFKVDGNNNIMIVKNNFDEAKSEVEKFIDMVEEQNKDLKCSRSHSNYDDYENSSVPAKNDNESSFLDVKNKSLNNVEKEDVEIDGFGDNMNKEQYIDFYDTSKYADVTNDSNKLDHDLTNKLK